MFWFIIKISIGLLRSIVNASNRTEFVFVSNQKCTTRPTLHPNEYTQGLRYYPSALDLDSCVGSCNILNDLSNTVCALNKTEDLNLSISNMITGVN